VHLETAHVQVVGILLFQLGLFLLIDLCEREREKGKNEKRHDGACVFFRAERGNTREWPLQGLSAYAAGKIVAHGESPFRSASSKQPISEDTWLLPLTSFLLFKAAFIAS
jgi:hypothetical protein